MARYTVSATPPSSPGVQLLTVSSSLTSPVTSAGKITDVLLEAWAIFVVTAVAGSFATFFSSGDST